MAEGMAYREDAGQLRSWEGDKQSNSRLKARKGIIFFLNQLIIELTHQPQPIQP